MVDENYFLKQGEAIPDYNTRIANYNASKSAPTPAPAAQAVTQASDYYPRYTSSEKAADTYVNQSFSAPESEDQIYAKKAQAAQAEIDNLNRQYDSYVAEQRTVNEGRSRGTSSVNTLTGLAGSTEANVTTTKTDQLNQRDVDKINAERGAAIAQTFSKIRTAAVEEARQQRLEARQSAQDILAGRTARQQEAVTNLTELSKSGVTLEGLKQSDPESFQFFERNIGTVRMQAMMTLNRPQETIVDKRVEGGKYIIAYQNPLDGKIRIESVDLQLPVDYTKSIDAGDRMLFMPSNWDGDTSKLISINKGMTPDQAADNARVGAAGTPAASPTSLVDANGKAIKLTASQVDAISGFDNVTRAAGEALALLKDKKVQTGPVAGLLLQGKKFNDSANPDQMTLEQSLAKIKADFMKALSGAAVSESEAKRLAKFLPDIYDQEGVLQSKLTNLLTESEKTKFTFVSTLGAVATSSAPDGKDLSSAVAAAGYDYAAMRADGLSDDEIRGALNL